MKNEKYFEPVKELLEKYHIVCPTKKEQDDLVHEIIEVMLS